MMMTTDFQPVSRVNDVLDALIETRELISDPRHWCQGSYRVQEMSHDRFVPVVINERFCLAGALAHVMDIPIDEVSLVERSEAYRTLQRYCPEYRSPVGVNDDNDHASVIAFIDKVIAAERLNV